MKKLEILLSLFLIILISCKDNSLENTKQEQNINISWNVKTTQNNHIIAIIKDTTEIYINNENISCGDMIGVFYSKNDSLICCGKIIWKNQNEALTVWSDDPTTTNKDGLSEGEEMKWLIYHNNKNYVAYPEYYEGGNKFISGGVFKLRKLSTK